MQEVFKIHTPVAESQTLERVSTSSWPNMEESANVVREFRAIAEEDSLVTKETRWTWIWKKQKEFILDEHLLE